MKTPIPQIEHFSWGRVTRYALPDTEPKGRIASVIGHSAMVGGSLGEHMPCNEHEFFDPILHEFGIIAALAGYCVDVYNRVAPHRPGWEDMIINTLNVRHAVEPYDLCREHHYNDYNGRASGLFSYYCSISPRGKELARITSLHNSALLGISGKGWNGEGGAPLKRYQGVGHMVWIPKPVYTVEELGFGDNEQDARAMLEHRDALPLTYLKAVKDYLSPF